MSQPDVSHSDVPRLNFFASSSARQAASWPPRAAPRIQGYCAPEFGRVKQVFRENFERYAEIGASFCVISEGETVVDLWAGAADRAGSRLWDEDSLVCVFSSTKVASALCLLMLASEQALNLEQAVSFYWPEFAQKGKSDITLSQLLNHSAGLPCFDQPMKMNDLYQWDYCTAKLAEQRPLWKPGRYQGYHAITFGYLVGEIVRRVTGQSIGTYFSEQVAALKAIDFYFGLPREHYQRTADLHFSQEYPFPRVPALAINLADRLVKHTPRAFLNPIMKTVHTRSDGFRECEIPASNGHGNARSLAQIAQLLAGVRSGACDLVSPEILDRAMDGKIKGRDKVLHVPIRWGLGFALESVYTPQGSARCLNWNGYGGSHIMADTDNHLSLGYAMNYGIPNVVTDTRVKRLKRAVYDCLWRS